MKKIAYRKLSSDCAKFFLLILCTISVIIWILQAVNYLDFVIEDGHGFFVYFNFTLLSFPKIFSGVFPFAVFLAFSYTLLKYEEKNELIIFWNFGVKKINFINFFIKLSFLFVFISVLLNAVITPLSQDKARSFIRSSNLDLFESILKPKKFIDIIKNLTIYFDEKNEYGELKKIFLNERSSINTTQTTFAKKGILKNIEGRKILVLYDGKTIQNNNGKISEFNFSKTDFNISKYSSITTSYQKTQENSTSELFRCLLYLKSSKQILEDANRVKINNCIIGNLENIYEELYSRLIKPLYTTFLIAISLLFILKSKNDHTFKSYKLKVYSFGFFFIIFLESSSKLISTNALQNFLMSALPFIFVLIIYFYFLRILLVNEK
jgi:lipopolysaccharide export system permease protein